MTKETHIKVDFRNAVLHHIVGNLMLSPTESPLILGIFGPPGEGKTYQTEAVCRSLGVSLLAVSPGELESPNAGHPGELLRTLYLQASEKIRSGKPTALIVNDIDTVLGHWGPLVQYTVNRQVVYGQLMSFCDYPSEVSGTNVTRVPIIVTGNDPTKLYGPLLRPGRMRVFPWVPTVDDRIAVAVTLFPELEHSDVADVVSSYPDAPISFWNDVRAAIWEEALSHWVTNQDLARIKSILQSRTTARIDAPRLNSIQLRMVAARLTAQDIRSVSFLSGSGGL